MNRIVELLRNEESRSQVQLAVAEQESVVTTFVFLQKKNDERQAASGKDDIRVIDAQCRP